ncbi:MAG TPA: hypothetical protein VFC07_04815 [Verrucomicrobiae bacterium]|nr:hypothetical protein [Verrucomicrobiae bacterium]
MSIEIKKNEIVNLDKIAANALSTLGISGSFEQTFAVAEAMMQLREAITPAMMERFMGLQNCKLGFMTDKNPKVWNKRENKYNEPYDARVVKDCVIEATLRGVKTIGNQFNIIASGCYITLEGFQYKLKMLEGFTEFKPSLGVPKIAQGGAIVECEATWKFKGVADSMKATIACKGDDYAGSDSYVGKAQRKFLKRIYERVTGTSEPDGEADAETTQLSAPAPVADTPAPQFNTASQPAQDAGAKPAEQSDFKIVDKDPADFTPQEKLKSFMETAEVRFETFRDWAGRTERLENHDSYTTWESLPAAFCEALAKDTKSLGKCVTLNKGK